MENRSLNTMDGNAIQKTFAVIENDTVTNLIIAESLEIAEEITGLTCVEYYVPNIGDQYLDGQFVPVEILEET
jgi:hypothetical protein